MAKQGWGRNLRKWRLQRGYTLAQLAAKSGLNARLLWQLEEGIRKGTPNQWLKLARTLGVEMRELISEPGAKPDDSERIEEAVSPYRIQVG
ncbi:MAG: helix-turn-helix domain-containing protein [Desulfitobacteriaceae bacterium]